ncbi:MAG: aldehyde dehydrogenase [Clostridia bacterium]|nr:aldehyde dehydrogenase [Clostridia bacterium]
MIIKSYNPSNNELLGQVESTTLSGIEEIVNNSKLAFENWGYSSLEERISYIKQLYDIIKSKKQEFAELLTNEMGMPISESLFDVDSGLEHIKWYIDNAKNIIGEKVTYEDEQEIDKVIFEPKGVVAVIIAWNFPFSSFVWQAIPNLIVGNTVIIKHSEYVPLCSKYIYDMVSNILPENVYSVVYGDGEVGEHLVKQNIDMICFTGSTYTGQKLYKIAGEKFIPIVLECGGSAPGIIFEDADIDSVIEAIYINKFANTGQICDGQKRLIVHESKFDEICEKFKKCINNKKIGNPLDENVEIGPLVSIPQLEKLENQVQDAVDKGAKIICGGERLKLNNGNYYLPTILTNITKDMKVYKEEVFGPVIPIIEFKTLEEAINIANDTEYGLGGYIYTSDKTKFEKVVKELKTGMIALNNLYYLKPCNPFGGYKKSGMGKNNSEFGLRELCNIKVVTYEK